MMRLWFWRLFFVGGFAFLIGVGVWAIVAVTRMRRDYEIDRAMLRTLIDTIVVKRAIHKLEDQASAATRDAEPPGKEKA